MTPRERQMRFRSKVKGLCVSTTETVLRLLFIASPFLMILHWLIVGY